MQTTNIVLVALAVSLVAAQVFLPRAAATTASLFRRWSTKTPSASRAAPRRPSAPLDSHPHACS